MSCEDFVISADGRKGIGVVQPQSGLDFPFVDPSDDVALLFADFYLSYDDLGWYGENQAPEIVHPLRLQWVYGIGCDASTSTPGSDAPTHTADLKIVDANNEVVFDSTAATYFLRKDWSDDYELIEWRTEDATCRAVVYTSWPTSIEPRNFPLSFYPERAILDERAVQKLPRRVRSIKVRQGTVTIGVPIANGSGRLEAGFNTTLTVASAANALRRNTNITILTEERREYTDCDETPTEPILRINGVAGKNGDFTLTGSDCIYARRPTTRTGTAIAPQTYLGANGYYMVGADCAACCDCQDYVDTATYMNRIRNRYKTIGSRTHSVKLLHEENIQRWLDSRDCRLERPLKIVMTPQCCPSMDVLVMFCNQCQSCAEGVTLKIDFSTFPTGAVGTPQCGYTIMYAPNINGEKVPLLGSWPSFAVALPPVDVGNNAYVKFRLKFAPRTFPYSITGTLTAVRNDEPIRAGCDSTNPPASALAVRALNCSSAGENIEAC